jgi:hypothetical protein
VSEQPSSPATPDDAPNSAWSPPPTPSDTPPDTADEPSLAARPEVKIGGAFVGGFALALLLRRLAG